MKESGAGDEEPAPSQDEEGDQATSYRDGWVIFRLRTSYCFWPSHF
jgi:hypothetical protein